MVLDSKVVGRASSKAPRRLPPFQQDECRRLLDAARSLHGAKDELPDGDLYLFLDGGRGIMDRTTYIVLHRQKVRLQNSAHPSGSG